MILKEIKSTLLFVGLGDTAKNYIKIKIVLSVNSNSHNKWHIIVAFKDSFLLLSEGRGLETLLDGQRMTNTW